MAKPKSKRWGNAWKRRLVKNSDYWFGLPRSSCLPFPVLPHSMLVPIVPSSYTPSWIFTCSSHSPEPSFFLWLIHTQTLETHLKYHICQTIPPSAWFICLASVFVVPMLLDSSGTRLIKSSLVCAPLSQAHASGYSSFPSYCNYWYTCLCPGLWIPWMGLCLSSLHGSTRSWN